MAAARVQVKSETPVAILFDESGTDAVKHNK